MVEIKATVLVNNARRSYPNYLRVLGERRSGFSIIGVALTILVVYYGFRTLKLFKGNVQARAWTYTSLSAVFFAIGVAKFIIEALQPMGPVMIGGLMQTVGAVFLVLGLRELHFLGQQRSFQLIAVSLSICILISDSISEQG